MAEQGVAAVISPSAGKPLQLGDRVEILVEGWKLEDNGFDFRPCQPHVSEEHRGIPFYNWGEDKGSIRKRYSPPAFDWVGYGGRISVQDEYVYRTVKSVDMEALIDTR